MNSLCINLRIGLGAILVYVIMCMVSSFFFFLKEANSNGWARRGFKGRDE